MPIHCRAVGIYSTWKPFGNVRLAPSAVKDMTDVTAGSDGTLSAHPLRAAVLGELHARPFTPIRTPARVLHFGFIAGGAQSDRATLLELCRVHGIAAPPADAKYHRSPFNGGTMRWESHSEFSTYRWELATAGTKPFEPPTSTIEVPMARAAPRGALLVAIDLHLIADPDRAIALEQIFDRSSLAAAENSDGTGLFATDFQPGADGFVRIIVADRGLGPERAGALVQRVLELETYRTLALLGLPEAQRLSPSVNRIEKRLAEVTDAMRRTTGLTDNNRLLDELTTLRSCRGACKRSVNTRLAACRPGRRSCRGAWRRRCARAKRWKNVRKILRANSRAPRTFCAHVSTWQSNSRTVTC
jgi:uncharacterized membrane-anchored protein